MKLLKWFAWVTKLGLKPTLQTLNSCQQNLCLKFRASGALQAVYWWQRPYLLGWFLYWWTETLPLGLVIPREKAQSCPWLCEDPSTQERLRLWPHRRARIPSIASPTEIPPVLLVLLWGKKKYENIFIFHLFHWLWQWKGNCNFHEATAPPPAAHIFCVYQVPGTMSPFMWII